MLGVGLSGVGPCWRLVHVLTAAGKSWAKRALRRCKAHRPILPLGGQGNPVSSLLGDPSLSVGHLLALLVREPRAAQCEVDALRRAVRKRIDPGKPIPL